MYSSHLRMYTCTCICVEGCCYNLDFLSEVHFFGVVAFLYRWQLRRVLHVSRCVNVNVKWDRQTHSLQLPLCSEVTLPSDQHCAAPGLVIHSRLYQVSQVKVWSPDCYLRHGQLSICFHSLHQVHSVVHQHQSGPAGI